MQEGEKEQMFKAVSSRVNFPEIEETILDYWKNNGIFKRSVEARKDGIRFNLYDGPPTVNGSRLFIIY